MFYSYSNDHAFERRESLICEDLHETCFKDMQSTTDDSRNHVCTAKSMNVSKISSNYPNSNQDGSNFKNFIFDRSVNHNPIIFSHQIVTSE